MASIAATPRETVSGLVCTPGTTSTSRIRGAGLKKCSPRTLSGLGVEAAIWLTSSEEVSVARMAFAVQTSASARKGRALDRAAREPPPRSARRQRGPTRPARREAARGLRGPAVQSSGQLRRRWRDPVRSSRLRTRARSRRRLPIRRRRPPSPAPGQYGAHRPGAHDTSVPHRSARGADMSATRCWRPAWSGRQRRSLRRLGVRWRPAVAGARAPAARQACR
jgi:hypothetical protein